MVLGFLTMDLDFQIMYNLLSNYVPDFCKTFVDGTLLNVEPNFCYLGDMLCAGGGCKLAIITRCGIAWGKFKRLLPVLTSRHASLSTRGKVFNACVGSALLNGSETWAPAAPDLKM